MMTIPGFFQTPVQPQEWLMLFLDMALKGLVILVMAGAVARALRKSAASVRHLVWSLAVAGLLTVPLLRFMIPNWHVAILPPLSGLSTAIAGQPIEVADAVSAEAEAEIDLLNEDSVAPAEAVSLTIARKPSMEMRLLEERAAIQPGIDAAANLPGEEPLSAAAQPVASTPRQEADLVLLSPSKYPIVMLPGVDLWPGRLTGSAREWALVVLLIWAAGALTVLTRLVLASARVWRIARRADRVTDPVWISLVDDLRGQIGLRSQVRLLRTERVSMPATWGIFRPVVLLPAVSEDWSAECRRIVLLHELSHIKRRDCLTQMLAQIASALHWYNPLAWSASRQLRVERELACDDGVLEAGTRPTDYAGHLVTIAASFESVSFASPMTVAMACSQLESRVRSILNPNISRRGLKKLRVLSSGLLSLMLLVPLSALRPWPASAAATSDDAAVGARVVHGSILPEYAQGSASDGFVRSPLSEAGSVATPEPSEQSRNSESSVSSRGATEQSGSSSSPDNSSPDHNSPAQGDQASVAAKGDDGIHHGAGNGSGTGNGSGAGPGSGPGSGNTQGSGSGSGFGSGLGLEPGGQADAQNRADKPSNGKQLTANELAEWKAYGITQELLDSALRMGLENLSINQFSQLRQYQITEAFVAEVRSWGFNKPTVNQLVQLRVAGVTSGYVQSLKNAGLTDLSINRLVACKMQSITPEYIESIRRAGFDGVTSSQLIGLRSNGITEQYIKQTQNWAGEKLSLEEVLQLRVFNVTPDTAREMRELGLGDLPPGKLVRLKANGVNGDFIREIKSLGFESPTADQLIRMSTFRLTPDYIRRLRAAGFKNVSLDRLIELKMAGIDEILLRNSR
jgi:beta-lactamase regulating signal transducer with metallopeptidase domain